jgi:hypothetical protein
VSGVFELADLLGVDSDQADEAMATLVGGALGVEPGPAELTPIDYASGSPATGALYRLRGDGWSLFCKVLQHVRHWQTLALMPAEVAAAFADELPWRSELELWDACVVKALPDGLRTPVLHRVVEMPGDRAAVWMEDVRQAPGPWSLSRFERAAYLLGRWNACSTAPDVLAASTLPPGYGLRLYAKRSVADRGLAPLASDELWSHPWLREHGRLRDDLQVLGAQIPEMLDRLDGYLQCLPHGDASPQNLLVPADDPETFVVIDLSFRSPHALGFDLGQLLVGLTHAGQVPAAMLPRIAGRVLPAYLRGLAEEGVTGQDAAVRDAFATATLLRSGFDSFLLDLLADSAETERHLFDERIELSRFLTEQYLRGTSVA